MAGKTLPEIYCWKIKIDRLTVHLASTRKGAIRVGLDLNGRSDSSLFFRKQFPNADLIEDHRMNQPLVEAIEAALSNNPAKNPSPFRFLMHPISMVGIEGDRHYTFWGNKDLWGGGVNGWKARRCEGGGSGHG